MEKKTFNGYVWAKKESWETKHSFTFFEGDDSNTYLRGEGGYLPVGAVSFDFEIPDSFNPVSAEVEMLNAKKAALENEFFLRIAAINDRISNLQCLEFNPTPTPQPEFETTDDDYPF